MKTIYKEAPPALIVIFKLKGETVGQFQGHHTVIPRRAEEVSITGISYKVRQVAHSLDGRFVFIYLEDL